MARSRLVRLQLWPMDQGRLVGRSGRLEWLGVAQRSTLLWPSIWVSTRRLRPACPLSSEGSLWRRLLAQRRLRRRCSKRRLRRSSSKRSLWRRSSQGRLRRWSSRSLRRSSSKRSLWRRSSQERLWRRRSSQGSHCRRRCQRRLRRRLWEGCGPYSLITRFASPCVAASHDLGSRRSHCSVIGPSQANHRVLRENVPPCPAQSSWPDPGCGGWKPAIEVHRAWSCGWPPIVRSIFLVTAQVGLMGQERRRDIAKFEGSRVRASMMFQPCFLAVERKERMSAKSIAPSGERKPPEIFCRSFIMRPSRSA